jgi:soluble lytic murein transglycosylase-like protein
MMRSHSFARACALKAALAACLLGSAVAQADQQRDPELRAVVERAISQAQCFADRYDSAVWYKMMEPKLRKLVPSEAERMDMLRVIYCETHRPGETRLPAGLIMGLMSVESAFNRYAVSSAGAVGLMQVMPFWPERLGMRRYELTHIEPNIHMGCAILRFYLKYERNDVARALARYNGSVGRRDYPDLVISQWSRWNGADDLGVTKDTRPAADAAGGSMRTTPSRRESAPPS